MRDLTRNVPAGRGLKISSSAVSLSSLSPVAEQDGHLSVVIRWDIGIRVDSENGISLLPIR